MKQVELYKSLLHIKGQRIDLFNRWIDPFKIGASREVFSELFYAGLCERRLNPDNHWSYQYRIVK